jgi:hypothetical protein
MVREVKRWSFVAGAVAVLWALPALSQGTPVDCGDVDCEGIREMKALYEAQVSYFGEKDRYSTVLQDVGFVPAPCADGFRALALGPEWVMGCNFAYRVTSVTGLPSPTFVAEARGIRGTPAEGVMLQVSSPALQQRVFWLERAGQRRIVGWDECLPAASFTCAAQEREGLMGLRGLSTAEHAYFGEKDRYSSNLAYIGFLPESCSDGTRPAVQEEGGVAGCRFVYSVTVTGPYSFIATARGVSGTVAGTLLRVDEAGRLTLTRSLFSGCENRQETPPAY